jgi:hypothetical protein
VETLAGLTAAAQTTPEVFAAAGAPTVNAYLTPAGKYQPFPLHNDEQDVFILQISGRKNWRVFNRPSERFKGNKAVGAEEPDADAITTTLRPGDLLYLPRRHKHEAWTEPGLPSVSLSVTMGWNQSVSDVRASIKHARCQPSAAEGKDGASQKSRLPAGIGTNMVPVDKKSGGVYVVEQQPMTPAKLRAAVRNRLRMESRKVSRQQRADDEKKMGKPPPGVSPPDMRVTDAMVDKLTEALGRVFAHAATGEQTPVSALLGPAEGTGEADQFAQLSAAVCLTWLHLASFDT